MSETEEKIHDLEGHAAKLRTKIKSCYQNDHFFDAGQYEFRLDETLAEIEKLKNT